MDREGDFTSIQKEQAESTWLGSEPSGRGSSKQGTMITSLGFWGLLPWAVSFWILRMQTGRFCSSRLFLVLMQAGGKCYRSDPIQPRAKGQEGKGDQNTLTSGPGRKQHGLPTILLSVPAHAQGARSASVIFQQQELSLLHGGLRGELCILVACTSSRVHGLKGYPLVNLHEHVYLFNRCPQPLLELPSEGPYCPLS